ncbi:MAG: general stress protein [Candidatus Eremiobacteraeota bacterium]|nr:general stress protein [Candidatus Eremiobacteraeota bacterium]
MIETGVFYTRHDAEEAVQMLHELGYRDDEISVMMTDQTRARQFAVETGSKVEEGTAAGSIVGGTLGGIVAALTTTIAGTIVTGGAALPLVFGPIAAILAGVGAGGVVGGIVGALVGMGIPETRAKELEAGMQEGGIVIAVDPHGDDRERVMRALTPGIVDGRVRTETGEVEPTEFAPEDEERIPPRRVIP